MKAQIVAVHAPMDVTQMADVNAHVKADVMIMVHVYARNVLNHLYVVIAQGYAHAKTLVNMDVIRMVHVYVEKMNVPLVASQMDHAKAIQNV